MNNHLQEKEKKKTFSNEFSFIIIQFLHKTKFSPIYQNQLTISLI